MSKLLASLICFLLPCLMSTLGAFLIFFFKNESPKTSLFANSLASGIMIAASIWSLLLPSIDFSKQTFSHLVVLPVVAGFIIGTLFMVFLDFVCEKKLSSNKTLKRPVKLFVAMTVHNIPEGMAVGFALGSAAVSTSTYISAAMFAVGIAIQNLPEGLATALPLQNCLKNRIKSFFFSFLSGLVEPVFAVLGFFLALEVRILLPWLLSFAGGAMIFVVVDELSPEIHKSSSGCWGTIFFCLGFLTMMILDVCF